MATTAQRAAARKAAAASVRNRRLEAERRLERAARRATQFTPGHDITCGCPSCEAGRAAL